MFEYRKIPFGLKNVGATFQRATNFSFHDLKNIIEVYLDDLDAQSRMRVRHPYHLRLVFERCHRYQIQLNPHKCIFYLKVGRLLGFIVSKEGIRADPLKVEAILLLSPKIIYFDSIKNLIHAMRVMNITNSLKAYVFYENFTKL